MIRTWLRSGAVLLLSALALAGCGQEQLTADQIVERMKQAQQQTLDLHSTLAVDFVTNERNGTMVVENWNKNTGANDAAGNPIKKQRAEVRQSSQAKQVGTVYVTDGQTIWLYNPSENSVVTGTRQELEDLKQTAGQNSGPDNPVANIQNLEDLVQKGLDSVNIEILPDEQVAGQATWKLKLTPKPQADSALPVQSLGQATLWVDQKRALPLKMELNAKDAGEGKLEARSIETNTGLADSIFTFQVPAGAKVIKLSEIKAELTPQKVTLDEARGKVDFPLLSPGSLPGGTSLVDVMVFQRRGVPVVVQNYSGDVSFSLVQSRAEVGNDRKPPAGSNVQSVTVRGKQATLVTGSGDQKGSLLSWKEPSGANVVIAGALSGEQAKAIAEGLK